MIVTSAIALRPGHWANTGLALAGGSLPQPDGVDLDTARANVSGWGGDPLLFTGLLRAALACGEYGAGEFRQLAAVAAWRSGVIGLRAEALRLVPELPAAGVSAVLGILPDELDGFAGHQLSDRYWWPGRAGIGGWVLQAGGFAGIGGHWISPPTAVGSTDVPGRWVIRADDAWWQLDADAFGSRLAEVDEAVAGPDTDAAGVRILIRPASYLVALAVPAEWKRRVP